MVAAAEAAPDRMPEPAPTIDEAIDAMATSDPGLLDAARKQALDAIKKYRADLDAVPSLKLLQDTAAGKFEIYDRVSAALDELEAALAG
jgi:hypothetical protein